MTTKPEVYLSIGDFSRATQLTIKMLRHYHQLGLLEPAAVDPETGYRRYTGAQIPQAQVIRRFRELDMPLDKIREVLAAPDPVARNERISRHLEHLEAELRHTQQAVDSLRALLGPGPEHGAIELRTVRESRAATITETVDVNDSMAWFQGALGEIHATLAAQDIPATGCSGGVYADELFTRRRGEATMFVPCDEEVRPTGRVRPAVIPAAELAVLEHRGSPAEIDRAYGTLAAHVARHALTVDGPLREYYLVSRRDSPEPESWRTEVCWPVFPTGSLG
jgi:DNA-binding transcriptional MerR regulator